MPLNISTITPAVLKAKEVATQEYVDTTTANTIAGSGFVLPAEVAAAINNNTTTIDGSKITTGTIQAEAIAAGAITADKVSADVFSGQTIIGGNIYGTRIEGASILGAVIKSSWIDYSNTGVLTNWQHFTPATVPSQYRGNFAKDNANGNLIVDSMGYVRLPGSTIVRTGAYIQIRQNNDNNGVTTSSLIPFTIPLRSYDYYQDDNPNRYINPSFTLSGQGKLKLVSGGLGFNGPVRTVKAVFYVGNVKYEVYGKKHSANNYTGYIKENDVTISSTAWSSTNSKTVNLTPYGIPVSIYEKFTAGNGAISFTVDIGNVFSSSVTNYTNTPSLINVIEAWADNSVPVDGTYVDANFQVFTAQN